MSAPPVAPCTLAGPTAGAAQLMIPLCLRIQGDDLAPLVHCDIHQVPVMALVHPGCHHVAAFDVPESNTHTKVESRRMAGQALEFNLLMP